MLFLGGGKTGNGKEMSKTLWLFLRASKSHDIQIIM